MSGEIIIFGFFLEKLKIFMRGNFLFRGRMQKFIFSKIIFKQPEYSISLGRNVQSCTLDLFNLWYRVFLNVI